MLCLLYKSPQISAALLSLSLWTLPSNMREDICSLPSIRRPRHGDGAPVPLTASSSFPVLLTRRYSVLILPRRWSSSPSVLLLLRALSPGPTPQSSSFLAGGPRPRRFQELADLEAGSPRSSRMKLGRTISPLPLSGSPLHLRARHGRATHDGGSGVRSQDGASASSP